MGTFKHDTELIFQLLLPPSCIPCGGVAWAVSANASDSIIFRHIFSFACITASNLGGAVLGDDGEPVVGDSIYGIRISDAVLEIRQNTLTDVICLDLKFFG